MKLALDDDSLKQYPECLPSDHMPRSFHASRLWGLAVSTPASPVRMANCMKQVSLWFLADMIHLGITCSQMCCALRRP